jgi:hypothetical protein
VVRRLQIGQGKKASAVHGRSRGQRGTIFTVGLALVRVKYKTTRYCGAGANAPQTVRPAVTTFGPGLRHQDQAWSGRAYARRDATAEATRPQAADAKYRIWRVPFCGENPDL